MYVVEDKDGAIALMLVALLCLGTWPAIFTLLERRGRLPQHTYLDYSITNLLAAIFFALTFGQIGDSKYNMPNFLTQLSQDNWPSILFAMAGGVVLSLGNLATQYALAFVGLSVTEVITCSIAVVLGSISPESLDTARARNINLRDLKFQPNSRNPNPREKNYLIHTIQCSHGNTLADLEENLESGAHHISTSKTEKAKAGTAEYLIELEKKRSIKVIGSNTFLGLGIVFFAGICFSLFSPIFNLATNDQWHTLKEGVPHLVVYTAFFYFSISCFILAIVLNLMFLYKPVLGLPSSSLKAYVNDWNGRQWALLAGLLCGFGNGFRFMGGQAAGYAASDAVQALPLVCTFWGIVLFGEYRQSSKKTYILLVSMIAMFIIAVAVLVASSGHRKT
ncbi:hypothetical protein KFK09_009299 [Dendrobium nobile]|uniref:Ureide permease 1-like n=1 Tax=Dendrobium nobile TaxID=94219 RepID=A0A8T3BS09_DENNO|nr:hypothetical protein KFK09_009299 [Dendrobium nobile]